MAVELVPVQCGFCNDGNHKRCAIGTKHRGPHEKYKQGVVWTCSCTRGECHPGRRKCADCGNRVTEEVNPATWTCFDAVACQALIETRRENNPFSVQLREIKERVTMAKIEENKTKAEKEQKAKEPTFCLVTGEPTKGGLFKPGMDARYVSLRVAEVAEANFTKKAEDAARKTMKDAGVSEKLIAKFDKSVGLAKEKAERAKAAAAEKEKAKAEKAKAS